MTRKHFIALAAALNDADADARLVNAIADVCADSNPNFNRKRFEAACGNVRPHIK